MPVFEKAGRNAMACALAATPDPGPLKAKKSDTRALTPLVACAVHPLGSKIRPPDRGV
jgi:hypothetical protein